MEAVLATFRVVIPIYLMIGTGCVAKQLGIFQERTLKEINASVFRLFLPLLLFENMYTTSMKATESKVLLYAILSVAIIFGICISCVFRHVRDRARAATITQGMYRSNFALLGIALTASLYGADGTEITGMLVAIIIPIYNVLAVILFEMACGEKRTSPGKIILGVVRNPLIIGTCLGLILHQLKVEIPSVINSTIASMGQIATPLALIVMGAGFEIRQTIKNKWSLLWTTMVRLLIIPVVFTSVAVLLGFKGKAIFALFVMYSTPTAVSSFAMASAMGGDENLAGEIVLVTTMVSMITLGFGVYILALLKLI